MAGQAYYAQVAVAIFIVLTLLHGLVWQVQRQRWSLLLATTFALAALNFWFDMQMRPTEARATLIGGLVTASGLTLLTLALIDYVAPPEPAARWARRAAVAIVVVVLVLRTAGWVPRVVASATFASYFVALALLMVWAMRREPRSGHGLVLLALLTYPAVFLLTMAGGFDGKMLRYLVVVPTAITGATILTTGLLRAQRRATLALQARQAAEDALRSLNGTLEQRVAQRTAELREVIEGLESFNRSVSHDLRGPLGGIAGVSRLATEAAARGDLSTVQRLLPVVTSQAESSSQLVAALLALARVSEIDLAPQPIDLQAFARDTLAAMQAADPAQPALPVEIGALPMVSADPTLLRQVLVNLIGNALKFSRQSAAPRVEVGTEQDDAGNTVFYVSDNGVGFDAALASSLFQPFQRLHASQFQGHGVGLSIVRRVVERHGGRVWARSAPGEGATFCFTLEPPVQRLH